MNIETIYSYFLSCNSVCTDTRKLNKNDIFFALKGDNFNGNEFAKQALKKGAKYAIIDEKEYKSKNTILVDNVLITLQKLATYHRNQLKIPIIALTGSNGKTTTKELINTVLSKKYKTSATKGNLNNHIGVPLTLLSMTQETEVGVVEMGANHQKEIEFLCNITLPDYGIITNFGKAHLEGFGGIEGVIKGKSELYDHLILNRKSVFINTDDVTQVEQIGDYSNKITFGCSEINDCIITFKEANPYVVVGFKNEIIKSQLIGDYNYGNIAVAIAIGNHFQIPSNDIKEAVENYSPDNNRSEILSKGSNTIILDAYNANPTSIQAALQNFEKLEAKNKIVFLGDMFELGQYSVMEHQNIVDMLEELNFQEAYLVGGNFYQTKSKLKHTKIVESFDDVKNLLSKKSIKNSSIGLIKGSRGMKMERILELIKLKQFKLYKIKMPNSR